MIVFNSKKPSTLFKSKKGQTLDKMAGSSDERFDPMICRVLDFRMFQKKFTPIEEVKFQSPKPFFTTFAQQFSVEIVS
jgi:hypothetical protein